MPSTICFAVAVYQNSDSLPELVGEIEELIDVLGDAWDYRIVFVDDGSTDGSFDVARKLARQNPAIKVVRLSRNFGQLYAMLASFDHAEGDVIVSVSADLQDPISVCADMLVKYEQGHEVIAAHRAKREDPASTRWTSKLAYKFLRLSSPDLPDGGFDYFMLSKRALGIIRAQSSRNRFFPTDVLALGLNPTFVPYNRRRRKYGKSQYNFMKRLHSMSCAVVDTSYLPIRLASMLGMSITFLGAVYAIIIVAGWVLNRTPYEGWAVIVMLLLIIGGATLFTLGIIGEYIWRIYDEVRGKPLYIIDRIVTGDQIVRPSEPMRLSGQADIKRFGTM